MKNDCLFCRIAGGTLPARKVFEDEHVVAFHDVNPQAPVHVLVIPRRHVASLEDLGPGDGPVIEHLHKALLRLAGSLPEENRHYRLVVNRGAGAGQSVFHLHWHFLSGRDFGWPPG